MQVQVIQSAANAHVKRIRGLKQKKNRNAQGLFLADGDLLVYEALKSGAPVEEILITQTKWEAMAHLVRMAQEKDIPVFQVSDAVMQTLSETVTPQGAAAVVRLPESRLPVQKGGLICLLEDVADPGNVGTIIRTADAVGADAVLLCGDCADAYAPKTVRASMGSLFHLPVVHLKDACETTRHYKQAGYRVVGTHLHGEDAFAEDAAWQKKTLLVTGSEARGMSDAMAGVCDTLLKLPMPGAAESLNAAVATGIFLYTWLRLAE